MAHLRKGSVEPNGTILCWSKGIRCLTPFDGGEPKELPEFLAPYSADSPRYDADLAELAAEINRLIRQTHERRRNKDVKLGLLMLGQGLLPVWKREVESLEEAGYRPDSDELVHLDDMSDEEVARALEFTE